MTKIELQRKLHENIMKQLRELQSGYDAMNARTDATLTAFRDISIRYTDAKRAD
jgi:hypothetical protein